MALAEANTRAVAEVISGTNLRTSIPVDIAGS